MTQRFLTSLGCILALLGCGSDELTATDIAREAANQNTVYLMGGGPGGTFIQLASDLSDHLDSDDLRVIALTGQGSRQAQEDLLYLEGVDIVMISSQVREHAIRNNLIPDFDLADSIQYISALFPQEFHLIVRDTITSIDDLEGRPVNLGPETSGGFLAGTILFNDLGIQIDARTLSNSAGVDALLAGEIDGVLRVAGQPTGVVSDIPAGAAVRFLSVPPDRLLTPVFAEATIRGESYPNLLEAGAQIPTLSSPGVFAVLNPEDETPGRAERIERFIEAYFANFDAFQDSTTFHPKWTEMDLSQDVPGWTRHPTALRLLNAQ